MAVNDVERYVPRGDIASQQAQDLAVVGFSPEFPTRLQELNDGLTYFGLSTFTGLRFNLLPDREHPKIDVETRFVSPHVVTVESDIRSRASLGVMLKRGQLGMLAQLRLSQVKAFTDNYPSPQPIELSAFPRNPDEPYAGRRLRKVQNIPLTGVSSVEDLESLGIVPNRYDIRAGFEASDSSLQLDMSYPHERRASEPVLMLHEFYARDRAPVIEAAAGLLGALLRQNWNIHLTEGE